MNADRLLEFYEQISEAPDAIARLRRFVLDLAVRGKLVEQDRAGETAKELLGKIANEKEAAGITKSRTRKGSTSDAVVASPLFDLPENWAWTSLAGVSHQIHYGYTASADPSEKEVRLLRITDIQNDKVEWNTVPGCVLDDKTYEKYALKPHDLLIARTGGTIGKTFLVNEAPVKSVFASYLIRVQPTAAISAMYIKLFCGSDTYWEQLRDGSRGGGQPNVNGQTLGRLQMPLPPLAEQHRIVAKIDELMALCDRLEEARKAREETRDKLTAATLARLTAPEATAASETDGNNAPSGAAPNQAEQKSTESGYLSGTATTQPSDFHTHARFAIETLPALTSRPDQIKTLRQTILNLAVRGKLVEQDPADEPVAHFSKDVESERLQWLTEGRSKKQKALSELPAEGRPFEIPETWQWVRLGDLVLHSDSGWSPQTQSFQRNGTEWGVLKVSAVSWGAFDPDANKQVLPGTAPRLQAQVHQGDFLISRANTAELVARAVIVEDEPINLMMSDKIVRLSLASCCNHRYLWMANNRPDYAREYYALNATGVSPSMKNVSRKVILDLPIPLPPLAEQHRIVAKVDALMALCDRLEAALTTADTTRTRLLEALLHEALEPAEKSLEAAE
jgi:type I restriction enzyme, S subunit